MNKDQQDWEAFKQILKENNLEVADDYSYPDDIEHPIPIWIYSADRKEKKRFPIGLTGLNEEEKVYGRIFHKLAVLSPEIIIKEINSFRDILFG